MWKLTAVCVKKSLNSSSSSTAVPLQPKEPGTENQTGCLSVKVSGEIIILVAPVLASTLASRCIEAPLTGGTVSADGWFLYPRESLQFQRLMCDGCRGVENQQWLPASYRWERLWKVCYLTEIEMMTHRLGINSTCCRWVCGYSLTTECLKCIIKNKPIE